MSGTLDTLRNHKLRKPVTYLLVGGWNTLFGVGLFTLTYRWLGASVSYLVLLVVCNVLAITNAFVGYKLLVFRTRGGWLGEYARFWTVYGASTVVGIAVVALLVEVLGMNPVVANLLSTGIVIAASFLGHSRFSFARR